jgi:hypothetical protein
MTKNSSDSNLESFIAGLESTKAEEKPKETFTKDGDELSFAGNTVELIEEKIPARAESIKQEDEDEDYDTKGSAIFKKSLNIFGHNFLQFCLTNLIITVVFLLAIFGIFFWQTSSIPTIKSAILDPIHQGKILIEIFLISWIYLSLLRGSYLTICSNYFGDTDYHSPILFSLKKLFSFITLEIMKLVMMVIGAILVFLAPFYGARYFLASPLLIEENEDAIAPMLKSSQIVQSWMMPVFNCMIFINFFLALVLASAYFGLKEFVKNDLILYSSIFFTFSFFLLPIHACFRFALYKKLQRFTQNQKFEPISKKRKIFFVFSRLFMLIIVSLVAFLLIVGAINGKKVLSIDYLIGKAGIASIFDDIFNSAGAYSAGSNN